MDHIVNEIIKHVIENGNLDMKNKYLYEDPKIVEISLNNSYKLINELETRNKYTVNNDNFRYSLQETIDNDHKAIIIYGIILDNLPHKWHQKYNFVMDYNYKILKINVTSKEYDQKKQQKLQESNVKNIHSENHYMRSNIFPCLITASITLFACTILKKLL